MKHVMKAKCATCPFRDNGWTEVRGLLVARAIHEATPICHSTGPGALTRRIFKEPHACRGARDLQLQLFVALGLLPSATDEAWAAKAKEMGL